MYGLGMLENETRNIDIRLIIKKKKIKEKK